MKEFKQYRRKQIAETTPEVGKTMTAEEIARKYDRGDENEHYADQDFCIEDVVKAMEEYASQFRQEVSDEEIELKRYINSYRPMISMEAAIWMRDRVQGAKAFRDGKIKGGEFAKVVPDKKKLPKTKAELLDFFEDWRFGRMPMCDILKEYED